MFFLVLFDFCLKSMVKYYENKVVCMVSEDLDKYWMWIKLWYFEIGINVYLFIK